jgi:hypothetical protein
MHRIFSRIEQFVRATTWCDKFTRVSWWEVVRDRLWILVRRHDKILVIVGWPAWLLERDAVPVRIGETILRTNILRWQFYS